MSRNVPGWSIILGALASTALVVGLPALAQIVTPSSSRERMAFRGHLERDGIPITGQVSLAFELFDSESAVTPLYWERFDSVLPVDGSFVVSLGADGRDPADHGKKLRLGDVLDKLPAAYVGVTVDGQPLSGRQQLFAAPFVAAGVPVGTIIAFGGINAPPGWLRCDGTSQLKADFPRLAEVLANAYGGDSAHFNLPDFRGRFLRGVAHGSNNDPDRGARTQSNPGGNSGDNVGSLQAWATAAPRSAFTTTSNGVHQHSFYEYFGIHWHDGDGGQSYLGNDPNVNSGTDRKLQTTGTDGAHSHSIGGGDGETRPNNVAVEWIIKY